VTGLSGVTLIAAGVLHSAAITTDGDLYIWGKNSDGQLGLGTTEDQLTPAKVPGISGANAIACGWGYTIADKFNSADLLSWGVNNHGQLGDGTTTSRYSPGPVISTALVTQFATQYYHVVAVRSDGRVPAWGYNGYGQLGDGTTEDRSSALTAQLVIDAVAVECGCFHSLALLRNGTLESWGANGYGQLGDSTEVDSNTRVYVKNLEDVVMIAVGCNHNLALKGDGSLWAWGFGTYGQLGDGHTASRNVPVRVIRF
jgi:alpha-tubulin suppressor-like RCC1 family protein